jgi:phosphoglycerate kinase
LIDEIETFLQRVAVRSGRRQGGVPKDWLGLDIGPETGSLFAAEVAKASTIVMNGPMGVFEFPNFAEGSRSMMNALVAATTAGATTIIGGGDTVRALVACVRVFHAVDSVVPAAF